jgi:RNA exonuclease 1
VLYSGIPFITRTFSHAYLTRAPGDANPMHSVLNTFFQTPVIGEEKKRRLRERIDGLFLCAFFLLYLSN